MAAEEKHESLETHHERGENAPRREGAHVDSSASSSSCAAAGAPGGNRGSSQKLEIGKTQYYPGHSFSHATEASRKKRAPPLDVSTVEKSKDKCTKRESTRLLDLCNCFH
eukprot:gb/GECG01005796.1/.p1 GENE.gb/GECG01005796.1/~~gb/GECG01005796.1/.p1  ORF type:complete len:110 (+),score=13.54 gb/GECG01005796.1/:1-330(+)